MELVIERRIIVEVKSVDALTDIHLTQVPTYLKLNNNRFALLFKFNVLKLKDGIKRVINGYKYFVPCEITLPAVVKYYE